MITQPKNNQIIIYNTEGGETKIEVKVENETVVPAPSESLRRGL